MPPAREDPHPGQVRPITLVGTPVLHAPCAAITAFDDTLAALVDDMFASMYAARGVGLAANQIGVGLRVFVFDCADDNGQNHVGHVVNPSLEELPADQRELDEDDEGCLSVPGQWAALARPDRAVVHGFDRVGTSITVEGTGLLARCLQHEVDHLDGYLYLDRLTARERKRVLRDLAADLARAS